MRQMGLTLLAGPANAGKVETLLERYLDVLERDPVLIVPNRSDVDRVERDLLRRSPALLGGSIGTFDDLFERIARAGRDGRPVVTETQRWLLLRRSVAGRSLNGLAASARFGGFADSLGAAVRELAGALPEPGPVSGGLSDLFAAYRAELDRLGLWDRELERAHAAGRGALELVGEEILELLRTGTAPDDVLVVCPSFERLRAPLETAFTTLGIPFAVDGRVRLGQTAYGHALLALLRFEWADGERRDLYGYLRSPYSGLARAHVDFLEGRLRGRAIRPERVEEETLKLRGAPLPALESLRTAASPLDAVRTIATTMARAAYGLESPP